MMKRLIGAPLLDAAAKRADELMKADPALAEAWLDQVRTSKASERAGGELLFVGDWDWVPAFWVWYGGAAHVLPRENTVGVVVDPPVLPEFEAKGRDVFQKPLTKGRKTTFGFPVLEVNEFITDGEAVAKTIAGIMNRNAREFTDG